MQARDAIHDGETEIFSAFDNGGPMWTGSGPRTERRHIRFEQPFLDAPSVHVALSMWDIASGANQRADLQAENISHEGFDLRFTTWGDTRVARARARWMAIGPVLYEEDWLAD